MAKYIKNDKRQVDIVKKHLNEHRSITFRQAQLEYDIQSVNAVVTHIERTYGIKMKRKQRKCKQQNPFAWGPQTYTEYILPPNITLN